ncbi:hypothetical protein [Parapedobacter sp. 10938]|uniref:hypothetical protein n=1 Tax=Parapedobacter flavus TaxID=3110225 RepID=UPI002DBBA052|nr:hypothetical protein [Parapedobacter sp. 10938]MEC3880080.1 hypothetical protein [Parapedobacter sp. 10938]
MKLLTALWAITMFSFSAFAQTKDSLAIDVVYAPRGGSDAAFMVNGSFLPNLAVQTIVPSGIKGLHIAKNDTVVNGHTYRGTLWITLHDDYAPVFVSLTELKQKYTELKPGPTVFMIDNQLINGNYDQLMVNEKYILKIEVKRLTDAEGHEDVNVVKLVTRSEENIRKSKEIRIRGNAFLMPSNKYSTDLLSIDRNAGIMR